MQNIPQQVYFELDLTNPYTIAALTSCQLLPRGLNLSQVGFERQSLDVWPSVMFQVLPPDVYTRLRGHLAWVKEQMSGWVTKLSSTLCLKSTDRGPSFWAIQVAAYWMVSLTSRPQSNERFSSQMGDQSTAQPRLTSGLLVQVIGLQEIWFLSLWNKDCQRHNGPEGWVHITTSDTNLDQNSISET